MSDIIKQSSMDYISHVEQEEVKKLENTYSLSESEMETLLKRVFEDGQKDGLKLSENLSTGVDFAQSVLMVRKLNGADDTNDNSETKSRFSRSNRKKIK